MKHYLVEVVLHLKYPLQYDPASAFVRHVGFAFPTRFDQLDQFLEQGCYNSVGQFWMFPRLEDISQQVHQL